MGKAGLTAILRDPTEDMVMAGMDAFGVSEKQAPAVFQAIIAVCDDDKLELKDFTTEREVDTLVFKNWTR